MTTSPLMIERLRRAADHVPSDVRSAMAAAARFRLAEGVGETLIAAAERDGITDAAPFLFWPAATTWIEATLRGDGILWSNCTIRFGLLFMSGDESNITSGRLLIFHEATDPGTPNGITLHEFVCDLQKPTFLVETLTSQAHTTDVDGVSAKNIIRMNAEYAMRIVAATLALLCSRRIYTTKNVDFDRLNRRREARGRWPLLAYKEVRISITGDPPIVTSATGRQGQRPLHFVRSFLRLRLGRFEIVHPHWRGNGALGIKRPAYVITP